MQNVGVNLNWNRTTKTHVLDSERSYVASNALVAQMAHTMVVAQRAVRDTDRNREQRLDRIGEEFLSAQVFWGIENGMNTDSAPIKVDRDMKLLPARGFKGDFATEVLPYIIPDSVELRYYKVTDEGAEQGRTDCTRIFWRWNTEKLAAAGCPLKVEDVNMMTEEVRSNNAEKGIVGTSNFTPVDINALIEALEG